MVTPPQFFNMGVSSFRARTDLHLFQSLCFLEDTIANVLRRWNFRELFPLLNFYKLETCVMSQDSARVKALSMNLIQIGPALVNSIWKVLMASFCLVLRYLQRKICQRSESSNTKKQYKKASNTKDYIRHSILHGSNSDHHHPRIFQVGQILQDWFSLCRTHQHLLRHILKNLNIWFFGFHHNNITPGCSFLASIYFHLHSSEFTQEVFKLVA